ncbi:SCO3374 family protein [Streptomyces sp. KMM 9044]|uniref:SCO3374 family protein n=1 Tax=Streptomyces sp. KMM 9044 TaxID=2744474 RepID=UPI002151E4CC|nr:SCO3374 family protein [Streptomyces sp. KMM 9044]WAX78715.1 SCO3374 family protein [Streptomyces sp. KMM 9044]
MAGTALSVIPVTPGPLVPAHRSVTTAEGSRGGPDDPVLRWYEDEQGWPTLPGSPVRLSVGVRFDVLDVPAEAGRAALERLELRGPVALQGGRTRLLVAVGSAEELPGLLAWLEWGTLALDLAAVGAGGLIDAPPPPGAVGHGAVRPLPPDHTGTQGAAVWLRPPEPGREVEASLPTLSATGGRGGAPDLVRLVNTVATQCHRLRLLRACGRPPAGGRGAGRTGSQPLACS